MESSTRGGVIENMSEEIKQILVKFPSLEIDSSREKIRCTYTGHEMPMRVDAVSSYVRGKKFKKAIMKNEYDFDQHRPHIVPSTRKGREHQLFCTLTLRHLNRTPEHIKKHVSGKRFKNAYEKWKECQRTGQLFKPQRSKQKRDNFTEEPIENMTGEPSSVTESGEESDVDSLSDLYPASDFLESVEGAEGSEEENLGAAGDGNMNTNSEDSSTSGVKRKSEGKAPKGKRKKVKSK